ncbi:RHS repeat domain-containing protein [Streptosporangium sandarakinum]|uniref:RHS repeat domain-containing protein n=1 Tax=Streptosporangium sandarakinum TaxID=1260955 RepID=UPI0033BA27BB
MVSEHTIGYQGNLQRSRDLTKLQNADSPGAYLENEYTYTYDPRDRIAKSVKTPVGGGAATTDIYWHDPNSNVYDQTVLGKQTTFTFDRNRLMTSTTAGATSTYTYDPYGRLRTITGGGKVREKYTYDGFDHVTRHEKLGGDGATSTVTTYTYDPLDRTTSKTEKEGTDKAKTTAYSYLGLSGEVLDEEVAGKLVRSFQYSPWGERLSQVKTTAAGGEESSYYGYNAHTDVEDITGESGDTRATYGYTAYGSNDDALFTGVDKPDPANPTAKDEYNPYRFNAKRWDNSTGMYDMGFRDYNPGLNRFLTLDSYNGALADLSLGTDPWTSNRYAFTGGNPITGIELDGHLPCSDGIKDSCGGLSMTSMLTPSSEKSKPDGDSTTEYPKVFPKEYESAPRKIRYASYSPILDSLKMSGDPGCTQARSAFCHDFPKSSECGSPSIIDRFVAGIFEDPCAKYEGEFRQACMTIILLTPGGITSKAGSPAKVGGVKTVGFVADSSGNITKLPEISRSISRQKQDRHILGGNGYRGGGYFNSHDEAQAVLDAYHSGQVQILGLTKTGNIQIRFTSITGYDNNPRAGRFGAPMNIFMIKGTRSPSVVPMNPNASAP